MHGWLQGIRNLVMPCLAGASALATLGGCYPGDITSIEETDVVLTVHEDTDFSQYVTYAMPDTVIDVCENADDPECENALDIDHSYDGEILDQIAVRMEGYGYQRVPIDEVNENNLPDLFATVFVFANERTAYTFYPWWGWWGWGGWWPGWGPGWGPGYPGGGVSVTRWNQGTLEIDLIDPEDTIPEEEIFNLQWTATLSGVLSRSEAPINTDRIHRAIQQAFDQSEYLDRNGN
jgi:hypothetical protein